MPSTTAAFSSFSGSARPPVSESVARTSTPAASSSSTVRCAGPVDAVQRHDDGLLSEEDAVPEGRLQATGECS